MEAEWMKNCLDCDRAYPKGYLLDVKRAILLYCEARQRWFSEKKPPPKKRCSKKETLLKQLIEYAEKAGLQEGDIIDLEHASVYLNIDGKKLKWICERCIMRGELQRVYRIRLQDKRSRKSKYSSRFT